MNRTVKSAEGLAIALRDLINTAGDGELLGGRLEGAIAEDYSDMTPPLADFPGWLRVTIGTQHYIVHLEEVTRR